MSPQYWLMKSEPEAYSIDDLKRDKVTFWDGVRNYQARNCLRDEIKTGDLVFFYHSNAEPPGIAGIAEVAKEGYPDPTQFDSKDIHYDPKSTKTRPLWYAVEIKFVQKFDPIISLESLRRVRGLEKMVLLQRGRLSVQPVQKREWDLILDFAEREAVAGKK